MCFFRSFLFVSVREQWALYNWSECAHALQVIFGSIYDGAAIKLNIVASTQPTIATKMSRRMIKNYFSGQNKNTEKLIYWLQLDNAFVLAFFPLSVITNGIISCLNRYDIKKYYCCRYMFIRVNCLKSHAVLLSTNFKHFGILHLVWRLGFIHVFVITSSKWSAKMNQEKQH